MLSARILEMYKRKNPKKFAVKFGKYGNMSLEEIAEAVNSNAPFTPPSIAQVTVKEEVEVGFSETNNPETATPVPEVAVKPKKKASKKASKK